MIVLVCFFVCWFCLSDTCVGKEKQYIEIYVINMYHRDPSSRTNYLNYDIIIKKRMTPAYTCAIKYLYMKKQTVP